MADGALNLNLNLNESTADRLAEKAEAMGVAPEALAAEMLGRLLDDPSSYAAPRTTPEDYDGPYVDLDDALDGFSAELEARLALRSG